MTVDPHSALWTKQYKELLFGFTEALGGPGISATRLAIAKQLATLQTELIMLSARFAAAGCGASAEDLNIFVKISAMISELMRGAGLGPSLQQPVSDTSDATCDREALRDHFYRLLEARIAEESEGIFRDRRGAVIDNTGHVPGCACAPCVWQKGNPKPTQEVRRCVEPLPATKPPALRVVKSEPVAPATPQVTPPPLVAERTTTERYYDWMNSGGGHWSGI